MVSEPTHIDGGLLDYLYLMKKINWKTCKFHSKKSIFFRSWSVKIHIQKGNGAEIDRNIDFTMSWGSLYKDYLKILTYLPKAFWG